MPIIGRVIWGARRNPLSDQRFEDLDVYVAELRRGATRQNVKGGREFENKDGDLPAKEKNYYREYDVTPKIRNRDRGVYRIVLGLRGEVYVTGTHYREFLQIVGMPIL